MEIMITSIASFISTNIDDIFLLMVLYAQASGRKDCRSIVLGQYLGVGLLVLISILGAWGTQLLPTKYVSLLGIIPICLGIKAWIDYRRGEEEEELEPGEKKITVMSVMLLAVANGADNIGVYIPVFSRYSWLDMVIMLLVFAGMIALWCGLAYKLANYPMIKDKIKRYPHIIVPVVLILLGLMIILEGCF